MRTTIKIRKGKTGWLASVNGKIASNLGVGEVLELVASALLRGPGAVWQVQTIEEYRDWRKRLREHRKKNKIIKAYE